MPETIKAVFLTADGLESRPQYIPHVPRYYRPIRVRLDRAQFLKDGKIPEYTRRDERVYEFKEVQGVTHYYEEVLE